MPTLKTVAVVIIHGTHQHLLSGERATAEVGDELTLSEKELLSLDPHFKNGIGHRFASPEKAAKLLKKAQLEKELAEPTEDADPQLDEPEAEEPPEKPAPKKSTKRKGG